MGEGSKKWQRMNRKKEVVSRTKIEKCQSAEPVRITSAVLLFSAFNRLKQQTVAVHYSQRAREREREREKEREMVQGGFQIAISDQIHPANGYQATGLLLSDVLDGTPASFFCSFLFNVTLSCCRYLLSAFLLRLSIAACNCCSASNRAVVVTTTSSRACNRRNCL
jgi:hypothetical protein